MKNKVLKISIILVMILSMTMTNFIFVGSTLISYAIDDVATNHKNVEFKAYQKKEEKDILYLQVEVKKEGYFNGKIELEESSFNLKEVASTSDYVNKIENNTIYLNQMNAGTVEEIKVRIEPKKEENFSIGLLNMESKIKITGIYKDSTTRDINIQATRNIIVPIQENNTSENIENEIQIITNQNINIEGQEKRVFQMKINMGLKENNYPMQEIIAKITLPTIEGKQAEIEKVEYLNNMTSLDYQYDGNKIELTLKNEVNAEGKVMWKAQGNESVIITCLYDADVKLENKEIQSHQKIKLYNNKEIEEQNTITVGAEELNAVVEASSENKEEIIYKGKLNAKIDRQYETTTKLQVNLAKAINTINITEENSENIVTYHKTQIKKEQFENLFGENGNLEIYDQAGNLLETINQLSPVDEQGNIVMSYETKNVTGLSMTASKPEKEGILEFVHTKTIDGNMVIPNEIETNITVNEKTTQTTLKLEEATTKAELEINKESLSTIIGNNVEIKAVLVSNDEKYNLYKNPILTIELPEEVENIKINSIDVLYDNELTIANYSVEGRTINISLQGEQTKYQETMEGATVVMDTTIEVNRKAPTIEKEIKMTYQNGEIGSISKPIKIVAPTDITAIYSMPELEIETIGQEETEAVLIRRNDEEKQIQAQMEIINNQEDKIENVKILGEFPTNHQNNNMGIEIVEGITLQGIENAKIYYSENINATDEIEKAENGWKETITNAGQVSKYLIVIDNLIAGNSVQASYSYKVPANLEYNKNAKTGYQVKYTNSNTKVENEITATNIELQTGIGPQVETKLTATVGGKEINDPVKVGEVIRYTVEVANTGTEEASHVNIIGKVPEGTTLVVPEENYEYTGASYYQELENKTYEETIESLKVGETIYKNYEVRVNQETEEGTLLTNQVEVKYGDVTKQTQEIKNVTANGNLRVTVKRITDRKVDLYTAGAVRYFAIIENIAEEKQENIKVETILPQNLEVERVTLLPGREQEAEEETDDPSQALEYSNEIDIGTLEVGETKIVSYNTIIHKTQNDNSEINFSVIAKKGQEQYHSNQWKDKVNNIEIELSMTTNEESQYLQAGDIVTYHIAVANKANATTDGLVVKDYIPTQLSIHEISQDGKIIEGIEGNQIDLPVTIEANATSNIKVEAMVDYSEARQEAEAITNVAYAELYGETIATTAEMNHIIKANENIQEETPGGEEGPGQNNESNIITGVAWYDENANGKKEVGEKLLSNIKVRLLNTENNEVTLETTTNENGVYVLDKIKNGNYIIIFDYDLTKYTVTKYKAQGIAEAENSNAIISELKIGEEKQKVTATDLLELQNSNISNINIGLIEKQNFDLSLDKYVSKILIQNSTGTTVKQYNNETMAKVELDAKTISGSTVIIEYKIEVTNKGEVEGYAKKIADYTTTDLKFSSELNKDWYQVGNTLYTTSLANEKIKPGETKTVTLTLTKAMTENSTVLMPNTAEIAEDYNELGIADTNSVPGNRAKGENDMGAADVLLSIKTGGIVYASIGIVIVAILGAITIAVLKMRKKQERE